MARSPALSIFLILPLYFMQVMSKNDRNDDIQYSYFKPFDLSEDKVFSELVHSESKFIGQSEALNQPQVDRRLASTDYTYFWSFGSWTSCSAECGEGTWRRAVSCRNRQAGQIVSPRLCDAGQRPPSKEACTGNNCGIAPSADISVQWSPDEWGPCSTSCDAGDQVQSVRCLAMEANQVSYQVDDELCVKAYGRKPDYRRSCNEDVQCPSWRTSDWSQCNSQCGEGSKSRQVYCAIEDGQRVSDIACTASDQPQAVRRCIGNNCDNSVAVIDQACTDTQYGCCQDGRTAATGPQYQGCTDCYRYPYGCCPDGQTPASGTNYRGCTGCSRYPYRCCPDGQTPAIGPNLAGCNKCHNSRFGCCSDGTTLARGPNDEGCPTLKDVCQLKNDRGPCTDYTVKWYYSEEDGKCDRFWYGGCEGNQNQFDNEDDCINHCKNGIAAQTGCTSSRYGCCRDGITTATGPEYQGCPERQPTGCKASRYGCCLDGITTATGPQYQGCPERQPTGCKASRYGCCRDGITTATGPQYQGCPEAKPAGPKCQQKSDVGTCSDYKVLWFYDSEAGKCDRFWYGGCGGNDNRFASEDDCKVACQQGSGVVREEYKPGQCPSMSAGEEDDCSVTCNSDYDCSGSQKCCVNGCSRTCVEPQATEPETREKPGQCPVLPLGRIGACVESCSNDYSCDGAQKCCSNGCGVTCQDPADQNVLAGTDIAEPACALDNERGPCTDYSVKWYYDTGLGKCKRFWYGGCEGNGNKFETQDDCMGTCSSPTKQEDVCNLPSVTGRCRASLKRWHFDSRIQECRPFTYGGCGGNSNRFRTRAECEKKCSKSATSERITNFHAEKVTSYEIMLAWEAPKQNQVENYKLEYMGVKYYRDNTKQDPLREVILSGTSTSYMMDNLMDAAEYTINIMPMFKEGSNGPKEKLVATTKTAETVLCSNSAYGCCPDGVTSADGPDNKGCADACQASEFGCCDDGETAAAGPNMEGCDLGSGDDDNFCEQSVFGCCPDGTTPAQGANMEGCGIDISNTRDMKCTVKPDIGRVCTDYTARWFYNSSVGRCDRFWYGGCDGNKNNYETEALCAEACGNTGVTAKPAVSIPVCEQPKVVGPCRAALPRYYYNGQNCEEFMYGGCQGNENNFQTEAECERRCSNDIDIDNVDETIDACLQPPEQGRCRARKLRWYFNTATGSCLQFVYGGCQGNNNRFHTKQECEQRCLSYSLTTQVNVEMPRGTCQQTMDTGPCLEHHPKWYYDASRKDCVEFDYGGCEGNDNNFPDRESCLRKCGAGGIDKPLDKEDVDICRLVSNEGKFCTSDVTTSVQKWFYDYNDGVCKQFTFKGCDGNKNNFATRNDCEFVCSRESVCKTFVYPPIQCLAYFRRYKFNPESRDCSEFIYGGCGGNSNNFATLESCLSKCAPERLVKTVAPTAAPPSSWKDICNMRADPGPCKAYFEKYYHNKDTYKCEKFVYGGCGGNQNQFDSIEKCESYCGESESIVVDPTGSGEIDDAYCRLPKESGNCVDSIPAWYFDYQTGTCQQFEYSGCGGNENRFTSKDTCETSCKTESMTTAVPVYTASPVYTAAPVSTASPVYTDRSVCFLPLAAGNCQDYTAMYYYDQTIKDCKPFWYTGCDGNENRFATGEECREKCWSGDNVIRPVYTPSPPQTTTTGIVITDFDVCNEKSELGGCTDYVVKWHYDNEEQRCKRFWYGGCDGNANNFDDENQCQETCVYRVRPQPGTTQSPVVDDCRRTRYGCCPDQRTPAIDRYFSNCDIQTNGKDSDKLVNGAYINVVEPPGRDVTIDCLAFKDRNYDGSVSWYKDGFLITVGRRYTITTDGALIISNSVSDDSGIYACRITSDMADPFVQRYRLQIEETVGIYPTPPKIIVRPGETAFLNCQAFGKPKPTVYWTRGGQPLPRDSRYETSSDGTLKISGTMENDVGIYLCVADNRISSPVQKSITLELRDSLRAEIDPVNGRLREGERLYLRCVGYGYPVPAIQWERSGRPLTSDQRISVTGGNLRVANVALEDTGLYKCILRNDEEKVEASVSIQVIPRDVKPENCADTSSPVKCRLIVRARLCGYSIYSKQCCNSCEQELQRLRGRGRK